MMITCESAYKCHSGIFFAFFGHFLHLLFPFYMHFPLCFPLLLLCLFRHIWPISLSNLISVILSFPNRFHLHFIFFLSFLRSHPRGQDKRTAGIWGILPKTTRCYRQGIIYEEASAHESSGVLRSRRLPHPLSGLSSLMTYFASEDEGLRGMNWKE